MLARGAAAALILTALAGTARAQGGDATLEGVVLDGERPVAHADVVVVEAVGERRRRAAVTNGAGRFTLVAEPGLVRLMVFRDDGRSVAARVLDLPAGRSFVTVGSAVGAGVPWGLAEGELLLPAAHDGSGWQPLARGRDLASLLEELPSGAPSSPASVGAGLAGTGPGELEMTLEGLDLRDPVDGRVPLELPLALFGAVSASHTWSLDDGRGGGSLRLRAPAPDRGPRASVSAGGGAVTPGRDGDAAFGPAFLEARATAERGPARFSFALAPRFHEAGFSVEGEREDARRLRAVIPALVRAEGEGSGWEWSGLALASLLRDAHERAGRIVPVGARSSHTRSLGGAVVELRRPFLEAPDAVAVRAAALGTRDAATAQGGSELVTTGGRLSFGAEVAVAGEALGTHHLHAGASIELTQGRRRGPQPSRHPDGAATSTRASATSPSATVSDRYRPASFLEVDLAFAVLAMSGDGHSDRTGGPQDVTLTTDPLLAPRLGLRLGGRELAAFVGAGRFGGPIPLEPLLTVTDSTSEGRLTLPTEDAAVAGAELRRGAFTLALTATERRTRATIEDWFSPLTGQLMPTSPANIQRRYRALSAQAAGALAGWQGTAAYTLSALTGAFAGYADPGAAAVRPGATAAFDTPDVERNRDGALSLDRRHAARLSLERRGRWRELSLRGGLVARLDQGTPVSALARSASSGPAQQFLVSRGSLGRTPWLASADVALAASRMRGALRLTLALEAFNLTDSRPVLSRRESFTDRVAVPMTGQDLGNVRGPTGDLLAPSPLFLAPGAYAEPLLVRLMATVEM